MLSLRHRVAVVICSCLALVVAMGTAAAAAAPNGPDVSSHNHPSGTSIDWAQVAATGSPFAFVKATEGVTYQNPYFVDDWKGIAAAGMIRGTYHYARPALPLSTAADQAKYFISVAGTTREPGDLPPVLDMEEDGGLAPADLVAWAQTFLTTVAQLTGRTPMIYTYSYFWRTQMGDSTDFTHYPLWIADYNGGTAPGTPLVGGWPSWTFWQYTATTTIDGISGGVDASRYCCSSGALATLAFGGTVGGGGASAPGPTAPAPPGAPTAVHATVGNASATLSWTAPSSDGGSPVTSYTVTPYLGSVAQPARVFSDPATTQALTGLSNGRAYTFSVHAANTVGPGAESARSPAVTPHGTTTASSDASGVVPTSSNPILVSVTDPNGGPVTITKSGGGPVPAGFAPLTGAAVVTGADDESAAGTVTLTLHSSALPRGAFLSDVTVFRNDAAVPIGCADAASAPCVSAQSYDGSVLKLSLHTVPAGSYTIGAARVGRVAGPDRIATAIATSQASYPAGDAGAVVLARSDGFADALTGTPLAAAHNAPLLLTASDQLTSASATELARVLPDGGTVYLLGGTAALGEPVAAALQSKGYHLVRYAGTDRYATAVAIANALGSPSTVFLATGTDFPDSLTAGVAAAHTGHAVLLTDGSRLPRPTSDYLLAHPGIRYAVGGPAAASDSIAVPYVGTDRYQTAIKVAKAFFPHPATLAISSGRSYPDALSAGPALARAGTPLLLTEPSSLPGSDAEYLAAIKGGITFTHLRGGTASVSAAVAQTVSKLLVG